MAMFNEITDNFTTFKPFTPEPIKQIEFPLNPKPYDISNFAAGINKNGNIIVKDETNPESNDIFKYNPTEEVIEEGPIQNYQETSPGAETLSNLIDEVSNEKGYKDLKNPITKNLLMLQAKRESGFNPKAKSTSSTATGYFQFIDDTREQFSSVNKEEFINNPKEQIRAGAKYLKHIRNSSNAAKLREKGLNEAQISALGWWYPRSMSMVLRGVPDYSLGGYSIKRALNDYKTWKV